MAPLLTEGSGGLRVQDDGEVRYLLFDNVAVQSAMRLSDPFGLGLSYTRSMMGFLLFNPEPAHIVLAGLGGGSLAKFCYRQLPHARITALEIDPAVIALRDEFLIPADDDRLRVLQADACDYLARDEVQADVILVDGYDATGLPASLCSEPFYADCRRALSARGVLVVNLWGGACHRSLYLERLAVVFGGRVWWSKPRDSSGLIAYAVRHEHYYPQWSRLMATARALEARYALGLPQVVNDMRERPDPDAE
jgi:spermidine synthase